MWHRPATAHRVWYYTDLSSLTSSLVTSCQFASPGVTSRIVRDLLLSGPQTPISGLAPQHIGGRPESSRLAPIKGNRNPNYRQVQ